MSSQLVLITAKVYTLLAATLPAGTYLHRDRTIPINSDELPAIVVYFLGDSPAENSEVFAGGAQLRNCSIRVEIRVLVTGNPPTPWEEGTDVLRSFVLTTLLADETLGGLAEQMVRRETLVDGGELDNAYAACALDFDYLYFFKL